MAASKRARYLIAWTRPAGHLRMIRAPWELTLDDRSILSVIYEVGQTRVIAHAPASQANPSDTWPGLARTSSIHLPSRMSEIRIDVCCPRKTPLCRKNRASDAGGVFARGHRDPLRAQNLTQRHNPDPIDAPSYRADGCRSMSEELCFSVELAGSRFFSVDE